MSGRVAPRGARLLLARFRSLRWRLTFLYLALLAGILLIGGVAQYFAAREVLLRTNAETLVNEYSADLLAFRRQIGSKPATPLRALLLSHQFANELATGHTSAVIVDANGGQLWSVPATLTLGLVPPTLTIQDYLNALRTRPKAYYLADAPDGSSHLIVLNVLRNGTRPIGVVQLSIPTATIDQALRADRELALAGSLGVLLIALLLSPLIIGRALRPLEYISASAGAMAAGDYKQRVAVPRSEDEISRLAVAFNQMAAGIDHAFEVQRQSEEQMSHFVADASHELRTPLTAIAGYIDVLSRRDSVDPETLRDSLIAMQRESSRMTRLVNDLLVLTRFESRRAPKRQALRLDNFLNQTLDELALPEHGSKETREIQTGIVVDADPEALKQVVSNLAQNGLKYAPGAEQRWSLFSVNGRAAIRVQDTGPGIARRDLPHIFERFYRGEPARDRATGGSGLGLAIVKSIVEAHQGSIEAESQAGQGATFTAWLPLASEQRAA
ncbi:MAG TPA: ATP-binding protein [Candidatus Dormibacteraeota bacterium]|nr:ATP-binding protein [Candidatus Dormibacteraeota bacterium]